MNKKRIIFTLILFILLNAGIFFSYKTYQSLQGVWKRLILLEKRKANWIALKEILENEFNQFNGEAGIVIKDLDMNWKISFNKDKLFPSASLVKVPIMLASFKAIREEKINPRDTLILKTSNKVPGSGILKDMPEGFGLAVEELIELMIINSDNTATNMLIDLLGFEYLNNSFKDFGLKNTNLSRKIMDFKYRKKGIENYTTAEDIAYILEKVYHKEFLNSTISEKCLRILKQQKIKNRIPARLPHETIVAHKTGLERNVCHDAGIVFTDKGNFLICILTKNTSSKKAKEFISEMALDVYNYYEKL